MPRAREAVPESAAANVGSRARVPGQVGNQPERNPTDPAARQGELRRGVLRQVEAQNRSRREDAPGRDDVDASLPAGGGDNEKVPAQQTRRSLRRVQHGRTHLHHPRIHEPRQPVGLPPEGRGENADVRGPGVYRGPGRIRDEVSRIEAADTPRPRGAERPDKRQRRREYNR